MSLSITSPPSMLETQRPGERYVIDPKDRELKAADFMQILVTQMIHQNPFQPMDSGQMMDQVSSMSTMRLSETLEGFSRQQNLVLGQGYLGQEVVVRPSGKDPITGTVTAVVGVGTDKCQLMINGQKYNVSDVVELRTKTLDVGKPQEIESSKVS